MRASAQYQTPHPPTPQKTIIDTMNFFMLCSFLGPSGPRATDRLRRLLEHAAILEADDAVGDVEMVLVVANDQECLARGPQFGQQLVIENLLERGILVCGTFVEDADGPILQQGAQEGQSPPLPL